MRGFGYLTVLVCPSGRKKAQRRDNQNKQNPERSWMTGLANSGELTAAPAETITTAAAAAAATTAQQAQ